MNLEPDCDEAAADRQGIARIVRAVLARAGFPDVDADLLSYPGLIAVANDVQRLPADATAAQLSAAGGAVQAALVAADRSRRRAYDFGCPAWRVDPAGPEPHLCASLARALAQLPARPDRVIDVRMADWTAAEQAVFCAAAELLAESWPDMLAELAVCVRQVALLHGYGIIGFSDFAVQGAIFVNVERFEDRDQLPGALRLAENLVHEGAHTRCYSAALAEPFLDTDRTAVRVATPLRPDPRPLFGLFQQLVVLCRCAELYGRVAATTMNHITVPSRTAVQTRRAALDTQARRALATLYDHADQLTEHGLAILQEAQTVIGTAATTAR